MTDWTYLGVVVVAAATLIWCMYIQKDRIKMMIEVDKGHEKKEEKEGAKKEEKGRSRNRWDYSSVPMLQRMGIKVDPKLILSTVILIGLTGIWLVTREAVFLDLVKINFGALLGTLIAAND